MEKILRKVSCKDRLPSINRRYYYTEVGEVFLNGRYFESQTDSVLLRQPEYWYEEVSVDELISYTDPIVVKRVIEIHNKLAKERYEKALTILDGNEDDSNVILALKIAAGLNEEEI